MKPTNIRTPLLDHSASPQTDLLTTQGSPGAEALQPNAVLSNPMSAGTNGASLESAPSISSPPASQGATTLAGMPRFGVIPRPDGSQVSVGATSASVLGNVEQMASQTPGTYLVGKQSQTHVKTSGVLKSRESVGGLCIGSTIAPVRSNGLNVNSPCEGAGTSPLASDGTRQVSSAERSTGHRIGSVAVRVDSTTIARNIHRLFPHQHPFSLLMHHKSRSSIQSESVREIPPPRRKELVGRGRYADVFAACDSQGRKAMAMKLLRLPLDDLQAAERSLHRECIIWYNLRHDNILPLLGVMHIDEATYMVSPYMANGDLHNVAAHRRPRDEDPAHVSGWEHHMIQGIAEGLVYLHANGVIHGDLKASNVLVGDDNEPKICDFGMTKVLNSKYGRTSAGLKGAGSWRWMAPELFDEGIKTEASDIYAFGMTVFEVVTGRVPFVEIENVGRVILQVISGKRPPMEPTTRDGRCFRHIWHIAAMSWAGPAAERPSASIILRRLRQKQRLLLKDVVARL